MSSRNSTAATKPSKPTPDFPLFPHATKRWAKKISGRMHYFGRWEDPLGALEAYNAFRAGRPVAKVKPGVTGVPGVGGVTPAKPTKPNPEFPLFAHASGQWAKKIRGKVYYFGPWADPQGSLDKYLSQKAELHSGRKPRVATDAVTIKDIVNAFLAQKEQRVEAGELSPRTLDYYKTVCKLVTLHLGKGRIAEDVGPDDFAALRVKMSSRWGIQGVATAIQYTRCLFKHAFDSGMIDRPVRFGPGFARPSKKTFRLERARKGAKLFTAAEIHALLGAANVQLRAMILLGINCGFGNADCGRLPLSAVDLDRGIIDYPRPKTGIVRRCILWPETVQAVRDALAARPTPKDSEDAVLVFVTKYGYAWSKETSDDPISKEIAKLLHSLGINGRKGLGFYTLRHTFRTVADGAKDQPAADFIMGHEAPHMSSHYREGIDDSRLRVVADHVRRWLLAEPARSQVPAAAAETPATDLPAGTSDAVE